MKRCPPAHWPQEGRAPNTFASTGRPAKKARVRSALKRLFDASGSGSASNGPPPKMTKNDAAPGNGGDRAATNTGGLHLSEEAIAELREAFALLHKDRNGEISPEDLGIMKRAFGQNSAQAEIEQIIAEVDTNCNGTVDFPEFIAKVSEDTFITPTEEEIREAFEMFDRDGNGFITVAEMRCVFIAFGEPVTDEEIDEIIRGVDMDGDGQINFVEFIALVTSA
ncbi:hypothetical protein HPB52_021146 [Rhipicephalus sanguineus]|uniref:EF-hand domain-containing protein n=1 Tax=Rhipicephalus sanguineus TaxID=34632 RepID=A0A9D4Q2R9_RHISA|nr:hypothetical protein HPB52_021146 [Rhipicephalus sanguineus]